MKQFVAPTTARNAATIAAKIVAIVPNKNELSNRIVSMFADHAFREDFYLSVWQPSSKTGLTGLPDVMEQYVPRECSKQALLIYAGRQA